MKTTVQEDHTLLMEEIYNPITLKTAEGEILSICMRDSGFEFTYQGNKYSAQKGILSKIEGASTNKEILNILKGLRYGVGRKEEKVIILVYKPRMEILIDSEGLITCTKFSKSGQTLKGKGKDPNLVKQILDYDLSNPF